MVKNLPANAGDMRDVGSIPGSGRSPDEGQGNPLQRSVKKEHTLSWVFKAASWQSRYDCTLSHRSPQQQLGNREQKGGGSWAPQPHLALDYNMGPSPLLVSDRPLPGKAVSGKQEDSGEACPRLWNV